jgi:hypothetical protein
MLAHEHSRPIGANGASQMRLWELIDAILSPVAVEGLQCIGIEMQFAIVLHTTSRAGIHSSK